MNFPYILFHTTVLLHLLLGIVSQFLPAPMPFHVPPSGPVPLSMPAPMHMPMPMQMPMTMPQQKLPVIMLPHYSQSQDRNPKKAFVRKPRKKYVYEDSSCSDSSSDSDAFSDYTRSSRKSLRSKGKKRREVLTPVVSYMTKDGYVVYQKKIKKDKAKDWLEMEKKLAVAKESEEKKKNYSDEIVLRDIKELKKKLKYKKKKKHRKDFS